MTLETQYSEPCSGTEEDPPLGGFRRGVPRPFMVFLLALAGLAGARGVPGEAAEAVDPERKLQTLTQSTLTHSPAIHAARWECERALYQRHALDGFFDPRVTVSSGAHEAMRRVPGMPGTLGMPARGAAVQGAIELPLRPGGYVSAGISERYLRRSEEADDRLFQTLVAAGVRVPLGRDRGFRLWDLTRIESETALAAATALWGAAVQEVRYDVTRRYLEVLSAAGEKEIALQAQERFARLLHEAQERVRLKDLPAYQLEPVRMEYELRTEEVVQARSALQRAQERLQELTGPEVPCAMVPVDAVQAWAERTVVSASRDAAPELQRRWDYRYLAELAAAADVRVQYAREDARNDVALEAAIRWQGEDRRQPLGGSSVLADERVGGELMLVWRRSLGGVGERARSAAESAARSAAHERLRGLEAALRSQHANALQQHAAARERLHHVAAALAAAQETLLAEQQRFQLGDGRSRNVLDAQKDLTEISRRRIRVSIALLHAWAEWDYTNGYAEGPEYGGLEGIAERVTGADDE